MKIGDYVECIRSGDASLYSVGTYYEVEGLVGQAMLLRDNKGNLHDIPIPMQGVVWGFAPVKVNPEALSLLKLFKQSEDEQTAALIELLEISQADVEAGRVMTREQLLESLSKD